MKMSKEENKLKQILDRYHTLISPIEEKKNTQSDIGASANILNNLTQSKNQIPNSNEPRHKNLEKMLKKLNTEQEIDYMNKTTYNDSFYSANQQLFSQIHIEQNNNNTNNFLNNYDIINRSHQQESHHKSILASLKRTRKLARKGTENLFGQATETIIAKQSFTSVFHTKTSDRKLNLPLVLQCNTSNIDLENKIYLTTSAKTNNIVESIDSRIRELKLKFLRDTHINIIKLSEYQNTLLTVMSFLNEQDIQEFYNSCTKAKQLIRLMINTLCKQYIVNPFIEAYGKWFVFQRCLIVICSSPSQGFKISAVIQSRAILPKEYNDSSLEFSNMISIIQDAHKTQYKNSYRFDYFYFQNPSTYWLIKEETFFIYDDLSKAYCMPLIPISFNDSFSISVNLISKVGIINFTNFKWENITYKSINIKSIEDYLSFDNNKRKKSRSIELSDYDLSRFPELELIKTKWMDYFQSTNIPESIHNRISKHVNYLKEIFSIDKIEYDDVGFLIVRLHTVASCKGTLPINKETLGIQLTIRSKTNPIVNEIKKNGLIYDLNEKMEFRQGDKVIIYFSFNKTSEEAKQKINSFEL